MIRNPYEVNELPTHYLSPKLEVQTGPEGDGVYARAFVKAGELLTCWGGEVMTFDTFMQQPEKIRSLSVQVEEDLYLVARDPGPADCFNHSCDPNAGIVGQITLIAMRDIQPGEQVCFDYAMTDGTHYDEFECACGSPKCRKRITGEDWKRPELWERYKGHFTPYLQRRIDKLVQERNAAARALQSDFVKRRGIGRNINRYGLKDRLKGQSLID